MANLLIVTADTGAKQRAREVFDAGLQLTETLKSQKPSRITETDFAFVASFARRNGTGTPVVVDPDTGNWLVAVGTWFHDAGYASGQEERLLARFTAAGARQLASEVEGFFVITVGDAAAREVTLITDVAGTLHCYTRTLDGVHVISVSSLVLAALAETTLDAVGIQEFLQTAAMYEDRTFFNEVRKLEAATCFTFRDGQLQRQHRYWHANDLNPDSLDGERSVAAFHAAAVAGARKIAAAFPRPAVDLTGGYDSRGGVAAFLAAGAQVRTTVAGPPDHPDVRIAGALAQSLGLEHHYFNAGPVSTFAQLLQALAFTDGEFDLVDYARILEVQTHLSSRFDISINSYSGEIGRGYGWEVLVPQTGQRIPLDAAKVAGKRFVNASFDTTLVRPEFRIDPATHFGQLMARADAGIGHLPNTLQYDYCMTMLRCQRWYGRIASSTNLLWPCMSFFLLRSIMEPMLEANTRSRRNSLLFRRFLLGVDARLASHPLADGYPPLPATWRTVHRFWPLIPYYGGKVVDRIRRRLRPRKPEGTTLENSPRLRLWQDPAVQQALRSDRLRSTLVLDPARLARFIEQSRQPAFASSGLWALLLSLEITLQQLQAVQMSSAVATLVPAANRSPPDIPA